jgi:hypothetical protein
VFKFERDTLERAGIVDTATPVPPFLVSGWVVTTMGAGHAARCMPEPTEVTETN